MRQVEPAVDRVQQRILSPLAPEDRSTVLRLLGILAAVHNDVVSAPLQVVDLP